MQIVDKEPHGNVPVTITRVMSGATLLPHYRATEDLKAL
jgi:hypothetical protein